MFEKITYDGHDRLITNHSFEVKITPKIYDGGFTLTKTVKNNPLEIIEIRDIRLPLTEKEVLTEAKALLHQRFDALDKTHYTIQAAQ